MTVAKASKKSSSIKGKRDAAPHAATGDDSKITALDLKPTKLSPQTKAYFDKCSEKLGFVPNVLRAYSFDVPKLETFVAFYNDLMLAPSGLSKLEREMIAVAVSSANRCYYCLVAHGAAVRALSGDPVLGELMVMNYRAARLSKRHRAMLDFAVKLTTELVEDRGGRSRSIAPRRLQRLRYLGYRGCRRLLQHDQPRCVRHRHAPEQRLPRAGTVRANRP